MLSPEDREAIAGVIGKRMQERLGLTQEQWEGIRAAVRGSREAARDDVAALRQARMELRVRMADPAVDPAALKAAAARVKELQGRLFDRRIETTLAVRNIMTAEQWEKWQSLRRGRGGPHRGRMSL
jgi:Spy/CpxP family protein refolding chaperone